MSPFPLPVVPLCCRLVRRADAVGCRGPSPSPTEPDWTWKSASSAAITTGLAACSCGEVKHIGGPPPTRGPMHGCSRGIRNGGSGPAWPMRRSSWRQKSGLQQPNPNAAILQLEPSCSTYRLRGVCGLSLSGAGSGGDLGRAPGLRLASRLGAISPWARCPKSGSGAAAGAAHHLLQSRGGGFCWERSWIVSTDGGTREFPNSQGAVR